MFSGARAKLEDSRLILEQLRVASEAPSFRSLFNSFLNACRAITYALQKDGRHIAGFDDWYKTKQEEMKKDELLRFIHEARTADFHEGKHRLSFGTHVEYFAADAAGPPPSPNASIVMGADGIFWLVDEGTPHERRIPIKKGGSYAVQVSIENPPRSHRGRSLVKDDPITICQLALDYARELVHEARVKFGH